MALSKYIKKRLNYTKVWYTSIDLDKGIKAIEEIIRDSDNFWNSPAKPPTLLWPGEILPLSNLAAISTVNRIYTRQLTTKHKLIRTIDIKLGPRISESSGDFLHQNNKHPCGHHLFDRTPIALPLKKNVILQPIGFRIHKTDNLKQGTITPPHMPRPPYSMFDLSKILHPSLAHKIICGCQVETTTPPHCDLSAYA